MLSVQNLNKKNQVTARSIVCVTCTQYSIFFVLTIDYRTLNLCESDRKQVLSVRLIHCNMTFVGLVIKTIIKIIHLLFLHSGSGSVAIFMTVASVTDWSFISASYCLCSNFWLSGGRVPLLSHYCWALISVSCWLCPTLLYLLVLHLLVLYRLCAVDRR